MKKSRTNKAAYNNIESISLLMFMILDTFVLAKNMLYTLAQLHYWVISLLPPVSMNSALLINGYLWREITRFSRKELSSVMYCEKILWLDTK
jgi:hypothetical protein